MNSLTTPTGRPTPDLIKDLGRMTATRDMHLVELSLLYTLAPLLGVSAAALYRLDEAGDVLQAMHYPAADNRRVAAAHAQPLLERLHRNACVCTLQLAAGQAIAYPLLLDGRPSGALVFERPNAINEVEAHTVEGVLAVYANYVSLLQSSQRDSLTGLLNRHALDADLARLWERMPLQSSRRYWIGLLDVDHFKQINDNFGHMIGDEILLLSVRLLSGAARKPDLLYRYGGEEFVVIIAAEHADEAMQVFERLRRSMAAHRFPQVERVTISCGFCQADAALPPQTILHRADQALYQAKAAGRNRVCQYEALVAQGVLAQVASGSVELF